jgi:extracellular elastinolytic metalloproteinase
VAGAGATPNAALDNGNGNGFQGEDAKIKDVDARKGKKEPSAGQQNAAQGLAARWNKLGTPEVVARPGAYLATGLPSEPVAAAERWIADNRELLGLSAESARTFRSSPRIRSARVHRFSCASSSTASQPGSTA